MKWTWKHAAAGYAAVAFAVWLISYIVEWNIRTEGKIGIGDALLRWWGDVVMLQWVDTTLGAGFLAFGAGAFVYFAAQKQRQDQLQDRYAATIETRHGQLAEAKRLLASLARSGRLVGATTYMTQRVDQGAVKTVREDLAALKMIVAGIGPFAPRLAQSIGNLINGVQIAADAAESITAHSTAVAALQKQLAYAQLAAVYFKNPARLIREDGGFHHDPVVVDRDDESVPSNLKWMFQPK